MRAHALPWLLLVLLLTGCPRPLWLPDRNLKEYLSEQDVVGQWRLTAESLDLLTHDGFKPADSHRYLIALLADGTCRFQTVMPEIGRSAIYQELTGKWKLEHDETNGANTKIKNTLSLELTGYSTGFAFDKKNGALILWTFYGDPDSWQFIEYKKDAEPTAPANGATPGR